MSDVIKTEKAKTGDIQLIKYDDIKNQSTEEYFNENQFSIDAFKKKYALTDNETYVQALKRVCDYVASVEKTDELKKYWSERWFDEIYKDFWKPAGSIMQGAGSGKNISLSNCTTISLGALKDDEEWDNLESIIKNTSYEVAKTGAYRQGLGVDFSRLRPTGLKLENSAKMSTGPIHWMQFIDSISYYVGQNGRRVAQLFSLNIAHPDIENFITVKSDYTKIQNANISVQVTNDFYAAVTKDKEWEMVFEIPSVKKGDKIYVDVHSTDMDCKFDKEAKKWYKIAARDRKYEKISKKVPARKLLELIAKNMHSHAEPGILNIDTIRKYSNSDAVYDEKDEYDSRIISTNPCAEQALSRSSLCVLSSINCEKFSSLKEVYIKQLEKIAKSINRFLDNVNECELVYQTFAVPHQRLAMEKLRRIGAGYTNLAGWLFKKNLNYDSEEAKLAAAEFTKWYCYWLYVSGEELGKEKGDFGLFDKNKWKDALFVSRIIEESKVLNKEYNVPVLTGNHSRNCTYISLAPTGTISTQFRNMVLSYGIEPAFFTHYWKRTRMNNATYEYYFCVPKIVRDAFDKAGVHIPMESDTIKDDWKGSTGKQISKFIDDNKDKVGFKFKSATNIDHLDKLNLMCDVAKWVDSSISTTYLLNEKSNWKDVYNFILEAHKKDLKAIAAFPDKKMYGIVSSIPFRDLAVKLKTDGV
jgi:ribonucleoside-diphosphate reductase alpha chain